jgi:hypothetical protein
MRIQMGFWSKREYDSNGNEIYYEIQMDIGGNVNLIPIVIEIYYENSDCYIEDNRPKGSCNGKVVEIDGKRYQLKEFD